MTPEAFTATATVLSGLITGSATYGAARVRCRKEGSQKDGLVKEVATNAAVEAPYTVRLDELEVTFDDDGKGAYRWKREEVRARQEIQNLKIPFKWELACPGGRLFKPDARGLTQADLPVELHLMEESATLMRGNIVISGFLGPDSEPTSLAITQPFSKAFCMTRAEAAAAYRRDLWKMEYAASSCRVPVTTLVVTVVFPASHGALAQKPVLIVFYPETERFHASEARRITNDFAVAEHRATLTVDNPLVGLRYGISWMPPV